MCIRDSPHPSRRTTDRMGRSSGQGFALGDARAACREMTGKEGGAPCWGLWDCPPGRIPPSESHRTDSES
eukprot:4906881-Alexandrium_andersonii.AAC.1